MPKVLFLDDELTMVQMVSESLRADGHQVVPFTNAPAALEAVSTLAPELVVANLAQDRTHASVLALLQRARQLNPPALVLMITGAAHSGTGIEALKRGAYDYLSKPFTLEELKLRVQRALAHHATVQENASLRKQLPSPGHFPQIIGTSDQMQTVFKLVERLADSDCTVLLSGPTGTGKKLIARTLHLQSRRQFAPFIPVSCRGLPEQLLEEELFGVRKVPFNSHSEERPGLLKEANGGTLFLDEVDSLPAALQARLLRSLGPTNSLSGDGGSGGVDVRIMAATAQAYQPELGNPGFVRDFSRQLSPVFIALPPLRDRPEDIPLLITHFLNGRIHPRQGQPYQITSEALETCRGYRWPGNVRELETAIEHACAKAQDATIQLTDLPKAIHQLTPDAGPTATPQTLTTSRENAPGRLTPRPKVPDLLTENGHAVVHLDMQELVPLKKYLRDQEVAYLQRILMQVGGSKERAAELLGVSLATIYRKLSEPESTSEETESVPQSSPAALRATP